MAMRLASLDVAPDFKAGDPPPEGYLAWHEWAETQHKAGLRQVRCGRCVLWRYRQELSGEVDVSHPVTRYGEPVEVRTPVCLECAASAASRTQEEATR
jgi:hypothetical protein